RAMLALLDALDEGVLVFERGARLARAGRGIAVIFGIDPRALAGLSRREVLERLLAASGAPPAALAELADDALAHESTAVDPIELVRPHARVVVWTSVPIPEGGRIDIVRDVTRERSAERASEVLTRRLEEVTTVDDLTGLVNRRGFEKEIDREHR